MLDALSGLAAQLVKMNLTLRLRRGKKFNAEGNKRNLNLT
jgi:hypothetical protein